MKRHLVFLLLAVTTACGGSGGSTTVATVAPATTVAATTVPAPTTPPTATPPSTTEPPTTAIPEVREPLDIEAIELGAVATGERRPVLSWGAVPGATRYALVVRDGAGNPYWAWTGADTTVRFGGNGEGENGQVAMLHETMRWQVVAFDGAANLLGYSDAGTLEP